MHIDYYRYCANNAPIHVWDYQENVVDDTFKDVESPILREDWLDCDTDFHDYVSGHTYTNTFSITIQLFSRGTYRRL